MLELVEDVHLALEAAWDIKAPDVPGVCLDGWVESCWAGYWGPKLVDMSRWHMSAGCWQLMCCRNAGAICICI